MKFGLVAAGLLAAIGGIAAPAHAENCAPAKLLHLSVANVTPGLAAGSFASKPKEIYRIGSGKLRIEEGLDAAKGIQALTVVSEPNIWLANLFDHTGKHAVDPGPTFFARAPVFGMLLSKRLTGLEFGCENDFIAANALKPVRTEQIGATNYNVYRVEDGGDAIEILEPAASTTPAYARYYRDGKLGLALHYELYAAGLPDDPSLFTPPPNVQYTEISGH